MDSELKCSKAIANVANIECAHYSCFCTLLLHNTSVQTKIGWHAYTTHENIFDMWVTALEWNTFNSSMMKGKVL